MAWTLQQLANHVGAQLAGDGDILIESVATLESATAGQISFLTNPAYVSQLASTRAAAVILRQEHAQECKVAALVTENPHAAYARIAQLLSPAEPVIPEIHPSATVAATARVGQAYVGPHAVIEADVVIGDGVYIGANSYIGAHAHIEAGTRILQNVTICSQVRIGQRCLIHPGVVIGADGFGQAYDAGKWIKIPQTGAVRIGHDVEIGANTTIDRGAIEDTVIEDGVKLDNLIQIAHNVRIGRHTVIAAMTGIAGSAQIGSYCMIGGSAKIAGHISIADKVTITALTFVSKSIPEPGSYSSGITFEPTAIWHRIHARFKRLDEMGKAIRRLEKNLKNTEE